MRDLDVLKRETNDDLRAARERRQERDARAARDLPILDAFDRMARGEAVDYSPGPRHAPKLGAVPSDRRHELGSLRAYSFESRGWQSNVADVYCSFCRVMLASRCVWTRDAGKIDRHTTICALELLMGRLEPAAPTERKLPPGYAQEAA